MSFTPFYEDTLRGGSHWSLHVKRNTLMRLTDLTGLGNVGMLFYNPVNPLERYNAPDTLKCQHTFKLTTGHCLYSDMGRIFCSIVKDDQGWHDTVCGTSDRKHVREKWGNTHYQTHRNRRHQNGLDSFLVELGKYGLGKKDIVSNLNLFSSVRVDEKGFLSLDTARNKAGASLELRFEMDTLVVLHTCPHPLNSGDEYPVADIGLALMPAAPIQADDVCLTHCPENERGFENNRRYLLTQQAEQEALV